MKVTKHSTTDISWRYSIQLDKIEWPPILNDDTWYNRPIRRWVNEHCFPVFFTFDGLILFVKEEDYVNFVLTWG